MSAPSSFHRFSSLPLEKQLRIWRYAATPSSHVFNLDGNYFRGAFDYTFGLLDPQYTLKTFLRITSPESIGVIASHPEAQVIIAARTALLRTCSVSRRVVWQAWRRGVASSRCRDEYQVFSHQVEQRRDMVLSALDKLTRQVTIYI